MLVLTQREGEVLEVGDNVRIHIKRIKGNWVRLVIDAPPEVSLQRVPVDIDETQGQAGLGPAAASPQVIRVSRSR
ncbi:MAG: carbon storage regulator [Myxococcota bacterium]|nr:carbon storage regulator [Myxococcota bacterium]